MTAAAAAAAAAPMPPQRLRIGHKKSHWLLEAAPAAAVEDPEAALRRRLAGLGTSELSLFAVSEFDTEFRRLARLRRRLADDARKSAAAAASALQPAARPAQRPVTCQAKVRFAELTSTSPSTTTSTTNSSDTASIDNDCDDDGRPRTHTGVGDFKQAEDRAVSSAGVEDVGSVSGDDYDDDGAGKSTRRPSASFPADLTRLEPLPVDPAAAARADARRARSLRTLRAVTGAGDSKSRLEGRAYCDSAWLHTPADFARPRSVPYGQNLRLHPSLADSIRAGILAGRRAFDCVSLAGLCQLDRRWPTLAKTRHDRVIDWLREVDSVGG